MTDKKLETADELLELFNDKERLKDYKYSQPVQSVKGINNEKFHMDLPYEEIKEIVEKERERVFAAIPEDVRKTLVWEHVGSTSIKGMPGTMIPDALLVVPSYPPAKEVIQGLLDCGFYFSSRHPFDMFDLWFMYIFTEGLLEDHKLTVHLVTEESGMRKMLLDTRDMCRTEKWAFEDYKNAKIEAAKAEKFMDYKKAKGGNSKLLAMLREKHFPKKE